MKDSIAYRHTLAGRGSLLHAAITTFAKTAQIEAIYKDTTARFDALYPGAPVDRRWFESWKPKLGIGHRVDTKSHGLGKIVNKELANDAWPDQEPRMVLTGRFGVKLDDADKYPWYTDGIAYFQPHELEPL